METDKVNDCIERRESEEKEEESEEKEEEEGEEKEEESETLAEKKHYAAMIGDVNINLQMDVQLPCEVKVHPPMGLGISNIEACIDDAEIDPDETAVLVLHAGAHEWSTSRTSDSIASGEDV